MKSADRTKETFHAQQQIAFTNAKGGRIFVGVSDAKKISGVQLSGETLNEWLNQIKNSTYPSIKIYDDRIEFFNPGKLHGDLTVEKLQSGDYSSRTRNRAVANIFKECGIIERYGSGIKRVQNACAQHGIPSPLFEEFQHGFKVTLLKPANGEGVSEGVAQLIDIIYQNPGQRVPFLATTTGIPRKTIERWLKQLKERGEIEFRGAPRTGGYFVTDKKK